MKTLKWLWLAALLTIGFKLYNLMYARSNGYNPSEMDSFIGMIFVFILLSVALVAGWVIGRAKTKIAEEISKRKSSNREH